MADLAYPGQSKPAQPYTGTLQPGTLQAPPNPRNPMMSSAFAQAPRAFSPTQTAFATK